MWATGGTTVFSPVLLTQPPFQTSPCSRRMFRNRILHPKLKPGLFHSTQHMEVDVWEVVRGLGRGGWWRKNETYEGELWVGWWAEEKREREEEKRDKGGKWTEGDWVGKGIHTHTYDYIERRGRDGDGWGTRGGKRKGMERGLKGSSNTLHSPAQQMPHSVWHSDLWACLYLYPHCVTPGPAQGFATHTLIPRLQTPAPLTETTHNFKISWCS